MNKQGKWGESMRGGDISPRETVRLLPAAAVDTPFLIQWRALAHSAARANPFYEDWYLLPSLREYDTDGRVRLFTVFVRDGADEDRLIGLLPIVEQARYGRWPFAHIGNWVHPNIFLGIPLIAAGWEAAFWRALLSHCDGRGGRTLFLHLQRQYADAGELAECAAVDHRAFGMVQHERRAMLSIDGRTPDAYIEAAVRGKKRKEYRRQANRLGEMGALTHHRREGRAVHDGLNTWIDEFLALEAKGWKGQGGSALASNDDSKSLFRDALYGAADAGRLQLLDIRLDGQAIAMLVNFITPPAAFSFKTTYDEDFSRFSPGVLLQFDNLELLNQSGLTHCDSCAAQDHPMIDSLWMERCDIGRYSIAIGGPIRRRIFAGLLNIEQKRMAGHGNPAPNDIQSTGEA